MTVPRNTESHDDAQTDPSGRLRVPGWLPSRNDSTATVLIQAVPAMTPGPGMAGGDQGLPIPPPGFSAATLEPVEVGRPRRGRWWFVVAPVAVIVLVVAVGWQFRSGGAAVAPDLVAESPRVQLPVVSESARTNESPSASPSSARPSASASASAARGAGSPSASASVKSTAPPAPTAHRGAIVGVGGRCLSADRDRPELAACVDRADQRWSAPGDGTVRVQNRCLDVFASGEANGTPVILYQCNRSDAQQWQLRGDGTWRNPQSNRCLSTVGGRADPGTRLVVFDCAGAAHQKWTMN